VTNTLIVIYAKGIIIIVFHIYSYSYSYKNLKQELKTVKVNSEKNTQVYGMYMAV